MKYLQVIKAFELLLGDNIKMHKKLTASSENFTKSHKLHEFGLVGWLSKV